MKTRSVWRKNQIRDVLHSLGRYFAIVAIIALGVGFFAGLTVAEDAMVQAGDKFVRASNMFDYRLLSTLGLREEDIAYFAEVSGVEDAEGLVSVDALWSMEDRDDGVYKTFSITERINQVDVLAGTLPAHGDECAVDSRAFTEADIGKTLYLSSQNDEDTMDMFTYREYTITAVVQSVNYLNFERGTTSLGTGTLTGFVYFAPEGYDTDYFTECYVTVSDAEGLIFSDAYETSVASMKVPLEEALALRAEDRYQEILEEANAEIADGEREYNDAYEEYLAERAEAETELEDARVQLQDALDQIEAGEAELLESEELLKQGDMELEAGLREYEAGVLAFEEEKEKTYAELDAAQKKIDENRAAVESGFLAIEESGILTQYEELKASEAALLEQLSLLPEGDPAAETLTQNLLMVQAGLKQIEDTGVFLKYEELEKATTELAAAQETLDTGRKQAEESFLTAQRELQNGKAELDAAREEIESGYREIENGRKQLLDAREEYEEGLSEYYEGKQEADESFLEAEEEFRDAWAEIEDARQEVAEIEKPDTFLLDRNTNTGYVCFQSDSSIVRDIAKVFPVFFFLVAAIVCTTTMMRMVEEQRTQIGTFKALGFSNGAIISKYILYSGSAALLGCMIGYFGGSWMFPYVIWQAYNMYYGFTTIGVVYRLDLALFSLAASMLCSAGTTYLACRRELFKMPARLMRPKTPKAGKRIFLERIGFLWKHLGFMHKVSIRNIIRYKQRLIMMVLGIGGCTALVLTGFGVDDSVANIANDQYDEIHRYDFDVYFADGLTEEEREEFLADTDELFTDCVFVVESTAEYITKKSSMALNLMATDDPAITKLIDLHNDEGEVAYPTALGEVVISDKLAERADAEPGDSITIKISDTQNAVFTVSGICDNRVGSYVYMSEETYRTYVEEEALYKNALTTTEESDVHGVAAVLMEEHGADSVSVIEDFRARVDNMMESLNYVVVVIIVCAAALAFVVLFNLSNISITERIREIATIKVLGFYDGEVSDYVFRENFILTFLGVLAGLPMGVVFHSFVMNQINIDSVSFKTSIYPLSYLFTVAITFSFTILVDLMMRKKLRKINMAESLKSVE